jgi:hypothetical protein
MRGCHLPVELVLFGAGLSRVHSWWHKVCTLIFPLFLVIGVWNVVFCRSGKRDYLPRGNYLIGNVRAELARCNGEIDEVHEINIGRRRKCQDLFLG